MKLVVKCDYCKCDASLVTGKAIYPHRADLHKEQFWSCVGCGAWVGCHKNTNAVPLGRLANETLRRAKRAAHAAFDPLWKSGAMSRKAAYQWLSEQLTIPANKCHIGMFDDDRCKEVVRICLAAKA